MKRLFQFILLTAMALGVVACALDPLTGAEGGGAPVAVSFDIGLADALTKATPETTPLDNAGGTFQLYVAVFDKADGTLSDASLIGGEGYQPTATLTDGAASIQLRLPRKLEYRIVFFAQREGAYSTAFSKGSALFAIKGKGLANDASLDAFYASVDVTAAQTSYSIKLKRPFAQLNVLVPNDNVPEGQGKFTSEVTVKMPISFDLLAGKAGTTEAPVSFSANAIDTKPFGKYADTHRWIGMNYVLVPESGKVEVSSFREAGMDAAIAPGEVPVKVNSRTNLVGRLYGEDLDFSITVTIDPNFGGEEEFPAEGGETPAPAPTGSDTIVFADLGLENGIQYPDPFEEGDMSVVFEGGENDGKYYNTGNGIRIYGDGSVTVSSELEIVKIEFTYSGSNCPVDGAFSVSSGSYDPDTQVWTGSANSVTLTRATGTGHWRLQKVTVYYGTDQSADILEHAGLGCYLPDHVWSYAAGTDQYVREYDGAALTFVLMKPAEKEQLVLGGYTDTLKEGDAVTLTLDWKKGTDRLLFGTYSMIVVKVEGKKVWIADRRGNGFVIKK